MQVLFAIAFLMLIVCSLFIGNAMSNEYGPYATIFAGLLYFIALFIPFLGEYNIIHRSFSSMGRNFKKIIGTNRDFEQKGQMEIISPTAKRTKAAQYNLESQTQPQIPFIFFLSIASLLFTFDLVNFYFLWEGGPPEGPVTNF